MSEGESECEDNEEYTNEENSDCGDDDHDYEEKDEEENREELTSISILRYVFES